MPQPLRAKSRSIFMAWLESPRLLVKRTAPPSRATHSHSASEGSRKPRASKTSACALLPLALMATAGSTLRLASRKGLTRTTCTGRVCAKAPFISS